MQRFVLQRKKRNLSHRRELSRQAYRGGSIGALFAERLDVQSCRKRDRKSVHSSLHK